MSRNKLGLTADERTTEISDEALYCRTYGHKWAVRPYSEQSLRIWLRNGVIENARWCENGCGSDWIEYIETRNFTVIDVKRTYPKGYLLKPGSGRLPRNEARKSRFMRQWPQFA